MGYASVAKKESYCRDQPCVRPSVRPLLSAALVCAGR